MIACALDGGLCILLWAPLATLIGGVLTLLKIKYRRNRCKCDCCEHIKKI